MLLASLPHIAPYQNIMDNITGSTEGPSGAKVVLPYITGKPISRVTWRVLAIVCPMANKIGSNFEDILSINGSCLNEPQRGQGELLESSNLGEMPRIMQ